MADILLVDDEAAVRWVVADALRRCGHECREAGDGAAALAAVRERDPDVVLCDLRMPRMDGFAFFSNLSASGRARPPVVFLTSHDDQQAMEAAKGGGAFDYLVKPCEEALLRDVVERALAHGPVTAPATTLASPFAVPPAAPPPAACEEAFVEPPSQVVSVPPPHTAATPRPARGWLRRVFGG